MSADPGDEPDPLWTPTHQVGGVSGAQESTTTGVLVLAGTPIGAAADASPRLREALATADIVAAEDTRRLRRLVRELGVELAGRVVSYYDANESSRTLELLDALRAGRRVVVVTDAGMPSVSDPGYRLVAAAHDAGLRVTAVPGPSAVLTALAISGLPVDRFCFEGFLPRKAGERAARLRALADEPRTLVFFEAPHRLAVMLAALAEAFGAERRAAVCREMTKTYEEVRRGGLAELTTWATDGVRGEITIVVAGADPRPPADTADLVAAVLARVEAGERLKAATGEVAQQHGVVRRDLYQAVLDARAAQRAAAQPPHG
jgi:16S rRNA (cytidine1402-2'-O)-methyltransferase